MGGLTVDGKGSILGTGRDEFMLAETILAFQLAAQAVAAPAPSPTDDLPLTRRLLYPLSYAGLDAGQSIPYNGSHVQLGVGCRVGPDGSASGGTASLASEGVSRVESQASAGRTPCPSQSVTDLSRVHLKRTKQRRSGRTYQFQSQAYRAGILPKFGAVPLSGLRRGLVQEWMDDGKAAPVQRNREFRVLRAGWNYVRNILEWPLPDRSPFLGVEQWPEEPRSVVLDDEQLTNLIAWLETERLMGHSAGRQAANAVYLLALTGARRSEILHLDWSEVDLGSGVLRLGQTKTGAKSVWLSPDAVSFIRTLGPRESGPVICCADVTLRRTWDRLRADIGAPEITMHDLRRTYCTLLAEAGVDTADVAAVVGQKTVTVQAEHYRHIRPPRLRELATLGGSLMTERRNR